jgi:hypothetical protein
MGFFTWTWEFTKANGNASEMEIQKWGIKARTSRFNVIVLPYDHYQNTTITTTICASNRYMGGEFVAIINSLHQNMVFMIRTTCDYYPNIVM